MKKKSSAVWQWDKPVQNQIHTIRKVKGVSPQGFLVYAAIRHPTIK